MTKQNQTLLLQPSTAGSLAVKHTRKVHTQLLIRLGLRSQCCGARIVAWHHDKFYCADCESWLYRQPAAHKH